MSSGAWPVISHDENVLTEIMENTVRRYLDIAPILRQSAKEAFNDGLNGEVEMSNLAEVLRNAMSLDVHDRATLAERLLASLEELSEEEAERLWAEEAQRRLEEYRAGCAKAVPAEAVHEKAERLFR
jgi:putative addiction module component (TIGR02574 family)